MYILLSAADLINGHPIIALGLVIFISLVIIAVVAGEISAKHQEYLESDEYQLKKQKEWNDIQKRMGDEYENEAAKLLADVFGRDPIRNVIIPTGNRYTTEVDMIFVTKRGVFVVECKEHGRTSADRTGSWSKRDESILDGGYGQQKWLLHIAEGQTVQIDNAFNQNIGHIKALMPALVNSGVAEDAVNAIPYFSILATNCHFKMNDFGKVITDIGCKGFSKAGPGDYIVRAAKSDKSGIRTMKKWYETLPEGFTDEGLYALTQIIESYKGDEVSRRAHAEDVKYRDYEKERIAEYSSVKDADGLDDGGEFIKDYNPNSHRDI